MLICTSISVVGLSATLGLLFGMIIYVLLRLRNWTRDKPSMKSPEQV